MVFQSEYQLAAGNNNAGGLVTIEGVVPSGGRPFPPLRMYGTYSEGVRKVRSTGTLFTSGFNTVAWSWSALTKGQFRYLQETYCSDGYSGLVTVRTQTDDPGVYANYNAIMTLPEHTSSRRRGPFFVDVVVVFSRLEAI